MNRRLFIGITTCLILFVVVVSAYVLYDNNASTETEPDKLNPSVLWQIDLETFATDFAVANGKVFVSDTIGNVYCFDEQTGESVWNTSVGGYASTSITTYEGKVYVGCKGSVVNKLDADTGKLELSFQAPVLSSYGSKTAPEFFVADGKVVASQDGTSAYNASDGTWLWTISAMGILETANLSLPESDYVFIRAQSRINPNNGSLVWHISGGSSGATSVTDGKVLFWNYNPVGGADKGQNVLCVNASSGKTVWSFDSGTQMFQPIVSNGLVLFGAEDGYVYALDFERGNLEWKTFVDNQNILEAFSNYTEEERYGLTLSSSLVADDGLQRVFWSLSTRHYGTKVYNATTLSLDFSNGSILWTVPVTKNVSISTSSWGAVSSISSNNILCHTENSDLYLIDKTTGEIKLEQNFEHYVLEPIITDDKVFVAADLWLFSYE